MTNAAPNKFKIKDIFSLLKETFTNWNDNKPFDLSSSVAYYAIFSLPALLIIIISIAGLVFGSDAVQGNVSEQVGKLIGKEGGKDIQAMIAHAYRSSNSVISTIVGLATLLLGSTAVFLQLQTSLNAIWNVQVTTKSGIKKLLLDRATAFGVILAIGFMMLISLVITAGLSALSKWIEARLPEVFLYVFYVMNFLVSFSLTSLLFALIYKVLPDVKIGWKSVWVGSLLTAFLFELGRFSLSFYFGKSNPGSAYGAAGSVILIMLWVNYSCLILFFGAEFTQVFSLRYGYGVEVSDNSVKVKKQVETVSEKEIVKDSAPGS